MRYISRGLLTIYKVSVLLSLRKLYRILCVGSSIPLSQPKLQPKLYIYKKKATNFHQQENKSSCPGAIQQYERNTDTGTCSLILLQEHVLNTQLNIELKAVWCNIAGRRSDCKSGAKLFPDSSHYKQEHTTTVSFV